jgi:phosphonate degradation associated HDIG domain protein
MDVVGTIADLLETRGRALYFGEAISEAEHALQSAYLAEGEGADDALVVAALLHDIGHLLHRHGQDVADRGIDGRHEDIGHAWLSRWFGPAVAEPVQLHVAAKRYLSVTDPAYVSQLSPASRQSLDLQGGPFSAAEAAEFERLAFFRQAVRLRYWDDAAKVPGLAVPPFDHYRPRLERMVSGAAQ